MSDTSKKVLEKRGQGEYEFTPYGEFLSYFHAHIDLFKKILKAKKLDQAQIDAIVKSTKAYMTANVKKTDHFFEHLPQFATMLGVPQSEISAYLNTNFIDVLGKVKEKLKAQELEKLDKSPEVHFDRITEEIIERLGFVFPPDHRFVQNGILIVLENTKTGEIIEPQGLMAESAKAALAISNSPSDKAPPTSLTAALTQANAPPEPVKKQTAVREKEKSILVEIVEAFGDSLTGEKLDIQIGPPVSESQIEEPTNSPSAPKDDYEIEDLEFDGESEENNSSLAETEPDEFDQMLDISPEMEEEEETIPADPYLSTVTSYTLKEFFDLSSMISGFQQKADQVGYQNWLRGQGEFEKTLISIRTSLMKEQKGEPVSWDQIFEGITNKTQFQKETLVMLLQKLKNFQWVKMTLDRAIVELKKGSPEFVNLVRMAWPHIQKAFFDVPNYNLVQNTLKGILSRVNNEDHRKEFTRIFTMALNFIQTKYKV
ncbi:MAG: hypothetical protein SH817_15140 [Leptospira sp.]|nr:hypothetical protein [Leptospira sp.]